MLLAKNKRRIIEKFLRGTGHERTRSSGMPDRISVPVAIPSRIGVISKSHSRGWFGAFVASSKASMTRSYPGCDRPCVGYFPTGSATLCSICSLDNPRAFHDSADEILWSRNDLLEIDWRGPPCWLKVLRLVIENMPGRHDSSAVAKKTRGNFSAGPFWWANKPCSHQGQRPSGADSRGNKLPDK